MAADRESIAERAAALAACGANAPEIDELLAYNRMAFDLSVLDRPIALPRADEPFVATWDAYAEQARRNGVYATLQRHVPRLRFPIRAGISDSPAYRAATLRGESTDTMAEASGLILSVPEQVTLAIHPTPAGRIPAIVAGSRDDFVALVRCNAPCHCVICGKDLLGMKGVGRTEVEKRQIGAR